MWEMTGIRGWFGAFLVLSTSTLLAGCSSSDDGGAAAAAGLLQQAPHCPQGISALKIEGTIAGSAIDDSRTDPSINAASENVGRPRFYTPLTNLSPLADNQLTLSFGWARSIAYGETSTITDGKLTLPATHPQAGTAYCVSAGQVGYVDGGTEDGAFKFAITEVKAGADCSGVPALVDLRGCFGSDF